MKHKKLTALVMAAVMFPGMSKPVQAADVVVTIKDAAQRGICYNAIHWKAPASAGKTGIHYSVERKDGKGSYEVIADVTKKFYSDKKAWSSPGDVLTYRIRAYKQNGAKKDWYDYSNEMSVTMGSSKVYYRSAYSAAYNADSRDWVTPASETSLTIHWQKIPNASGYQILNKNGKRLDSVKGSNTLSYVVRDCQKETTYRFMVRAYKRHNGKIYYGRTSDAADGTTAHTIKGTSKTTPVQMARYFTSKNKKYPSSTYKKYGAPTINDFTQIVYDEANRAGVKAEVLFAQICCETGFLRFGGDVKAAQCNFGGLGAVGGGARGLNFVTLSKTYYKALGYSSAKKARADAVRIGIRAQATHIGYYATTDGNLPQTQKVATIGKYPYSSATTTLPDPRAYTSIIGKAPYIEWLGIPDNYYSTGEAGTRSSSGWAGANNYGYTLITGYINPMLAS